MAGPADGVLNEQNSLPRQSMGSNQCKVLHLQQGTLPSLVLGIFLGVGRLGQWTPQILGLGVGVEGRDWG